MKAISIFLSYSRENSALAIDLERALKDCGVGVWRDQEKLFAGTSWPKDLGEAVAANNALVLVWSQSAAQSKYVELEWCTALALGKPVLPYLVDEFPLPSVLASFHGLKVDSPSDDAGRLIQRLQIQPLGQSLNNNWLLTALQGVPTNQPDQAFHTVRAIVKTAATCTIGGSIGASHDEEPAHSSFRAGEVIENRYEVKSLLGRGGTGEVWRAFDLKLRLDVALKIILGARDNDSVELLRGEVRAAREVVSPNVCRIFDLGEVGGTEFLSMEYIDGKTLAVVMAENGPYRVDEASPLASQLLSSLQAIHDAGLVHRDIKPENLMLTRTGRLVVMDLGLARICSDDEVYSISGTPAYMSPEQFRGNHVDARSDIFAAGVVLAELTSPTGARNLVERQVLWGGIQKEPPELPHTPWAKALAKAVVRDPDGRYSSALAMARTLEKETVKTIGEQDASPYPGLAAFTETQAEYFFGREAEVESLWTKLAGQPRLLAVVGPSGAGKSSFLRAGVLATRPEGWVTLRVTPGSNPFVALGQAVARATPKDILLAEQMVRFSEVDIAVEIISRWAMSSDEALIIVDQFEELFTQNPSSIQADFANLIARLPVETDVHVVLGMRDDFLMACHQYKALAPVFSEMTPLEAPSGVALRRAIVQPALKCGFHFEDDSLVDEMTDAVAGERGALPLLAFACESLWVGRDREQGTLTRSVYQDIGGVTGALAGHAEATLDRIGTDRLPIVRELFRNLVTSQGTRAEQDRDALLSIFPEEVRPVAAAVLDELIDARLLVSFEEHGKQTQSHRVEIIHESLLQTWPRLVRWQTQDADAAQMRDQLRQSARLWEARGRSVDLLWSGMAFKEYDLWQEKYPGRLTDTEQDFARAMKKHANRQRRLRQVAISAAFIMLILIVGVVGRFWQQSEGALLAAEEARRQTETALSKSEANRLVVLGRHSELERNPSAAIGFAIASLELADSEEARRLALDALWRGPTALAFEGVETTRRASWNTAFSPDGRWLVAFQSDGQAILYEKNGGSKAKHVWVAHERTPRFMLFSRNSTWLWTGAISSDPPGLVNKVWSIPDGKFQSAEQLIAPFSADADKDGAAAIILSDDSPEVVRLALTAEEPEFEYPQVRLPQPANPEEWIRKSWIDPAAQWLASVEDGELVVRDLSPNSSVQWTLPVDVEKIYSYITIQNNWLAAAQESGEIEVFSLNEEGAELLMTVKGPAMPNIIYPLPKLGALFTRSSLTGDSFWWWHGPQGPIARQLQLGANTSGAKIDQQGDQLATSRADGISQLWPLRGPAAKEPVLLRRGDVEQVNDISFHPTKPWMAIADGAGLSLRLLNGPSSRVIWKHEGKLLDLAFAPDGRWLAVSNRGGIQIWPMQGKPLLPTRELIEELTFFNQISTDRSGKWILSGTDSGYTKLVSVDSQESFNLEGFNSQTWATAMSPDGRFAAASGGGFVPEERQIRIWDVATQKELFVLYAPAGEPIGHIEFCGDEDNLHLYSDGPGKIWQWSLATGTAKLIWSNKLDTYGEIACLDNGKLVAENSNNEGKKILVDLESGQETMLSGHPNEAIFEISPSGNVVASGDGSGVIRVSKVGDDRAHLLLGHVGGINSIAIDPAGQWIASAGVDRTLRLWSMPDLSREPFHELPKDEFLAHLRALTNYRAVADESEQSGFKVITVPFDGWENVPEWW